MFDSVWLSVWDYNTMFKERAKISDGDRLTSQRIFLPSSTEKTSINMEVFTNIKL